MNRGRIQPPSKPGGFESDARQISFTTTDVKRKRGSGRFNNIIVSRDIDDDRKLDHQASCRQISLASAAFQSR